MSEERLRLAAAVVFLNEEDLLPRMFETLARQRRPPELLLLVDDGSQDRSGMVAAAFAHDRGYVRLLERAHRGPSSDRLAKAAELRAFQAAIEQIDGQFDVVAKLDADLELPTDFFLRVLAAFESDPKLGIAGAQLGVPGAFGATEYSQPWHVRGATKFYRVSCWEAIAPLPPILGWDTIDETRAKMGGWDVRTVSFGDDGPVHLRPTGTYDGAIRGYRRRGAAAWGYGADPLNVLASVLVRMRHRPRLVGSLAYLGGWLGAALQRAPRAEPAARRYLQREQRRRLQAAALRRGAS